MTIDKDLKRLVRLRMEKTGESYTAARAQLLSRDLAEIAGMSDDAVEKKTGKTWAQWEQALNTAGAKELSHREVAKLISRTWPDLSGWWVQGVTVGYERIRGDRQLGEMCTGDFAASKSKTFPVPVHQLFEAFAAKIPSWDAEVRTSTAPRSVRLTWPDGTIVSAWFTDKGEKSMVAVQHEKLPDAARRIAEKEAWAERLQDLLE